MPPEVITSAANPLVKRVRLLASDRRARRREGALVVEGTGPVWRAVEAGADVETLLCAPDLVAGSAAERLIAGAESGGIRVTRLSAQLFERLAGKDGPAGVLAVVRRTLPDVADLVPDSDALVIGLHEVANPGNLGTILRAAEAAGAGPVVTIGASTDPFAPAAVKASMGSLFEVPVGHAADLDVFLHWADQHGLRVATTSAEAATSLWDTDWTPPVALLMGSEGDGLADDEIARGDLQVRIPMAGGPDSLNLAVATGILVFEARKQALQRPSGR